MTFYEKLRYEVIKRIMRLTATKSESFIENYYFDYNFFKRDKKRVKKDK